MFFPFSAVNSQAPVVSSVGCSLLETQLGLGKATELIISRWRWRVMSTTKSKYLCSFVCPQVYFAITCESCFLPFYSMSMQRKCLHNQHVYLLNGSECGVKDLHIWMDVKETLDTFRIFTSFKFWIHLHLLQRKFLFLWVCWKCGFEVQCLRLRLRVRIEDVDRAFLAALVLEDSALHGGADEFPVRVRSYPGWGSQVIHPNSGDIQ